MKNTKDHEDGITLFAPRSVRNGSLKLAKIQNNLLTIPHSGRKVCRFVPWWEISTNGLIFKFPSKPKQLEIKPRQDAAGARLHLQSA